MEHALPVRKQMRLPNYSYSQSGCYFLTVCTQNKAQLLCKIPGFDTNGAPIRTMTQAGLIVEKCIRDIPTHYLNVTLDHFVLMPNHIHLLLTIETAGGAPGSSRPTEMVPRIVSAMKKVTNRETKTRLWQTGYMDHVIRNQHDWEQHWNYIEHNPFRWAEDKYYDPL